jgi:hypothetical protein
MRLDGRICVDRGKRSPGYRTVRCGRYPAGAPTLPIRHSCNESRRLAPVAGAAVLVPHGHRPVERRLWRERQVIIRCYGQQRRRASAAIPYIAATGAGRGGRRGNDNTTGLLSQAAHTGVSGRKHPGEPRSPGVDAERRVPPLNPQIRRLHPGPGAGRELSRRPGAVFQQWAQSRQERQDSQDGSSARHGGDSTGWGGLVRVHECASFRKCGQKYHNVEFPLAYLEPPMLFVYEQVVCMRICGSRPRLASRSAAHGLQGGDASVCFVRP